MEDVFLRLCAPKHIVVATVVNLDHPDVAPIERSASYHADAAVARDLALSWLFVHENFPNEGSFDRLATLPLADVPTDLADGPSASVPATTTTVAQIPEVQQLIEDLVIDRGNLATALAERQINRKDLLSPPKLAEVESSAADAFQPAKKSPIKQGLLGVVIGMVVGAGLAVLRELLDDRIHTRHDLENASEKPVIS